MPRGFRRTGLHGNYPAHVDDVLRPGERPTFAPAALAAMRRFRLAKPWRGSVRERFDKLKALNVDLAAAYGMRRAPRLILGSVDACDGRRISLDAEHLSVVTYLHEFAHARGADEPQAVRWSVALFRRIFPRSAGRLVVRGHLLVRPRRQREAGDFIQLLPRRRRAASENAAMGRTLARAERAAEAWLRRRA